MHPREINVINCCRGKCNCTLNNTRERENTRINHKLEKPIGSREAHLHHEWVGSRLQGMTLVIFLTQLLRRVMNWPGTYFNLTPLRPFTVILPEHWSWRTAAPPPPPPPCRRRHLISLQWNTEQNILTSSIQSLINVTFRCSYRVSNQRSI